LTANLKSCRSILADARLLQPVRFLVVGGTTLVIYFVLQFLLEWAKLGSYVALTIAYATAIAYHFLMNRHFTFRSSAVDGGIMATLPRYASVVLLNYVILLIVVRLVMSVGFRIQVGMFAGIVLTTIVSFVLAKSWIFRDSRRSGNAPETAK
jgi:putative flippase GtrA